MECSFDEEIPEPVFTPQLTAELLEQVSLPELGLAEKIQKHASYGSEKPVPFSESDLEPAEAVSNAPDLEDALENEPELQESVAEVGPLMEESLAEEAELAEEEPEIAEQEPEIAEEEPESA